MGNLTIVSAGWHTMISWKAAEHQTPPRDYLSLPLDRLTAMYASLVVAAGRQWPCARAPALCIVM